MTFHLRAAEFVEAEFDDPENCATTAELTITADGQVLTEHRDDLAQSVRTSIRVALYPLAHWFASAYWRLCYEPLPMQIPPATDWRLTHELAAAGEGYLWPPVIFGTDGEHMHVWASPSRAGPRRAVQYFSSVYQLVPIASFQRELHRFIDLVVNRLDAVKLRGTHLESLWKELRKEIADDQVAPYRIAEARLGYDPDAAAEDLVSGFLARANSVGSAALNELAPVCDRTDPVATLDRLDQWIHDKGVRGQFKVHRPQRNVNTVMSPVPAKRGQQLAREVRRQLGIDSAPISNDDLAGCLGLTRHQAYEHVEFSAPFSLGIREDDNIAIYGFQRRSTTGRRFEIGRFIGDHISSDPSDFWTPVTKARTARQKLQRGFAAELLVPADDLAAWIGKDFSDESIDRAIERYGADEEVIKWQLVNNDIAPASQFGYDLYNLPYQPPLARAV
ncbi:MAG: hypothetical protein U1D69_14160 [Polynucleobacter sp.]|nr:hypothetical protein [Polynucleobacter sp.]